MIGAGVGEAAPPGEAVRTFADDILFQARMRPEQPAIALSDRIATYAMFARGVTSVEARLRALRLAPDELVAVALANPIRHLVVVAALFRLGQPSVSIEHPERVPDLRLSVRRCLQEAGATMTPGVAPVAVDDGWFNAPPAAPQAGPGFARRDALCRIEISSGSTGRPKAIASTVEEFAQRLEAQRVADSLGVRDRVLMLIGLTSGWGFRAAVGVLANGGSLVFAGAPSDALQMAAAYRVDALVASTAQARDLVQESKRTPLTGIALRAALVGGGLPTRALLTEARARLCVQMVVQYGATETGPIAITPADMLMEEEGATGYPLPGVTIEIVDAADRLLPTGESGVVRVRTPAMGRAFPPGSDGAHPNLRGGWFYPGDRGRLTADGMLALEGRASEVINAGGAKRAPELIEEIVLRHPNVVEAAAFGALGADGIDEIHLAVAARAPIAERPLIDWCSERGLAVARVFFVESLPRTPLGKIKRDELKASLMG
jgi:acyl-coenzyme A synthetase/AMP-(fatty) acid ligase